MSIRKIFLALALLSLLPLVIAYGVELNGFPPCPLCQYQRIPFFVTFPVALIGYFVLHQKRQAKYVIYFIGCAFFINAGLGLYHMGVENHWFTSVSKKCEAHSSVSVKKDITKQDILEDIENQSLPSCSKVSLSFLGLSMAGWNMIYNSGLVLLLCFILRIQKRDSHENTF